MFRRIFSKKRIERSDDITPVPNENILFKGLNEKQREAVKVSEGYVRVIAGAGSGKTKTLAHRFAYLVNEIGASPSNILCVTFTNKAAQEMKNRVRKLVDMGNVNDFICTYHGFCVKFLREDINKLSYPSSFVIMDEEDQKSVLREIYEELDLKQSDMTFKKVLNLISYYKSLCPYISDYIDISTEQNRKEFANVSPEVDWQCFIKYLQKQKKGFWLDFDDLMYFSLHILQKYDDIAEKWQRRLDYIMVDETQDNSRSQWGLVDLLQRKHKNLFIVGDPDQCIYEWRGADPSALVEFNNNYCPCHTVIMDQNYRSTPNILEVANSVISKNQIRIEKDLFSHRPRLSNVVHFHAKTEQEEGDYIAKTIINYIQKGGKQSDVAILYRSSFLSRFIEQSLVRNKLTYVVYGGIRFFERREIKDILAYLRMINIADDLSFKRVVNLPSRKLGKVFLSSLSEMAEKEQKSLYDTLKSHLHDTEFNRPGAKDFVKLIESVREESAKLSISDLAQLILEKSKLNDIYRQDGDQDRIDNIKDFIVSMQQYENQNIDEEDVTLTKYLQDVALYTNLDYKEDSENIKIMTIHQSKGLEFPIVFVAGMYEGTFPSLRTVRERKERGLEEERRLAYVAFTRAENELYLTESEGYSFETGNVKFPSRFIFEVKKNLLVREGILSKELERNALDYIQALENEMKGFDYNGQFNCGDKINHKVFGRGEIIELEKKNDNVTIKFEEYEEPRHLSIKKVLQMLDQHEN